MYVDDANLYLMSLNGEITIQKYDKNGTLNSTYWTGVPKEKISYSSFATREENGKRYFYLASNFPECRVNVFSIVNE